MSIGVGVDVGVGVWGCSCRSVGECGCVSWPRLNTIEPYECWQVLSYLNSDVSM